MKRLYPREADAAEDALNLAILSADVRGSYEEYVEIFDAFYADDVEVSSGDPAQPVIGKDNVRSVLLNFLVPMHVLAEIGGLSVSLRKNEVFTDQLDAKYTSWILELLGLSGSRCTVTWNTVRRWNGSRVVYERHYEYRRMGELLGMNDLHFEVFREGEAGSQPHRRANSDETLY